MAASTTTIPEDIFVRRAAQRQEQSLKETANNAQRYIRINMHGVCGRDDLIFLQKVRMGEIDFGKFEDMIPKTMTVPFLAPDIPITKGPPSVGKPRLDVIEERLAALEEVTAQHTERMHKVNFMLAKLEDIERLCLARNAVVNQI